MTGPRDVFAQIQAHYLALTATEKKVADYIVTHAEAVIYQSITDLAEACRVGESSVFRFCKTLGYRGYQDFKIALAHGTMREQELPQLAQQIEMSDTIDELSAKMLTATMQALTETHQLMSPTDVDQAVELLIAANRVHFFGVGASLLTALEAKNKFMRITNKTECSVDSHLQIMSASLMEPGDVAVLISYSGATKDTIDVAKVAQARGAQLIAITRFAKSPLTSYSDLTLLCGANEGPLQSGSLTAKISQLYLLDLLYAEYFKRTKTVSSPNKERTTQAVIDKIL